MSVKRITPSQRFSRTHPCPVCGGGRDLPQGKGLRCYGWIDGDERFVHCTREECADGAKYDEESQTFLHVRTADGTSYRPWTSSPPTQLRSLSARPRPVPPLPHAPSTPAPSEHDAGKTHPHTAGTTYFSYGPAQRIERKDSFVDGIWRKDCFSQHLANGNWSYAMAPAPSSASTVASDWRRIPVRPSTSSRASARPIVGRKSSAPAAWPSPGVAAAASCASPSPPSWRRHAVARWCSSPTATARAGMPCRRLRRASTASRTRCACLTSTATRASGTSRIGCTRGIRGKSSGRWSRSSRNMSPPR